MACAFGDGDSRMVEEFLLTSRPSWLPERQLDGRVPAICVFPCARDGQKLHQFCGSNMRAGQNQLARIW